MNNVEFRKQLVARSYKHSLEVIKMLDTLNKRDFIVEVLAKQLIRSATSIGANIVEAQAASSQKDFMNFLSYALKSANESRFWLGLLRDTEKLNTDKAKMLFDETTELGNILGASISTLRSKLK